VKLEDKCEEQQMVHTCGVTVKESKNGEKVETMRQEGRESGKLKVKGRNSYA